MQDIFDRLAAHIWISPDTTQRYLHWSCYKTSFSMVITIRNLLLPQPSWIKLHTWGSLLLVFAQHFKSFIVYNVTMITFILMPHLKHNEIVFPVGKNCPGRESVAAPLNILNICFQRKQKQFSNFHQTRHINNMTSRGQISTIPEIHFHFAFWRLDSESALLEWT